MPFLAEAHGRSVGHGEMELLWYAFELPKPCPFCLSSLPAASESPPNSMLLTLHFLQWPKGLSPPSAPEQPDCGCL